VILIAESGATKTDWTICEKGQVFKSIQTHGISPNYMKEADIIAAVVNDWKDFQKDIDSFKVSKIYFYGTGCGNPPADKVMLDALNQVFKNVPIEINNDILASARALCQREPGLVCILGTGSNSCYYDGENIVENRPAPGYVLGDYGSGVHIGITFLKALMEGDLSEDILTLYNAEINHDYETIITNVYRQTAPSKYLASFTAFVGKYRDNEQMKAIISDCFQAFMTRNVLKYQHAKTVPINFVGSIAHHFEKELKEVLEKNHLILGHIVQSPSAGLVKFHS
jgi:glucosamine kinase